MNHWRRFVLGQMSCVSGWCKSTAPIQSLPMSSMDRSRLVIKSLTCHQGLWLTTTGCTTQYISYAYCRRRYSDMERRCSCDHFLKTGSTQANGRLFSCLTFISVTLTESEKVRSMMIFQAFVFRKVPFHRSYVSLLHSERRWNGNAEVTRRNLENNNGFRS